MTSLLDLKRMICRTVYENMTAKGVRFRDGVVEEAARRAVAADLAEHNPKTEIEAMESAFVDYKIQGQPHG